MWLTGQVSDLLGTFPLVCCFAVVAILEFETIKSAMAVHFRFTEHSCSDSLASLSPVSTADRAFECAR